MTDIRDITGGTLVLPGEGTPIRMGALPVDLLVPAAFSGGTYELHEQPVPPGVLVVPHTHAHQDQVSIVTAGTLGVLVGDEEFIAPVGSCVLRPRGVVHALWNASTEPARMIEVSSPGHTGSLTVRTWFPGWRNATACPPVAGGGRNSHQISLPADTIPVSLLKLGPAEPARSAVRR